ncbi:PRC-barrel domain-containing protein [Mucilaginibacter gracilis]|nr:PRC-barrel domain-containing protein [Mucilaginibacter gracilis]
MKRDINSLIGYKIAATDGDLGTVKDFYFDDKTWTIRYLVVETGGWLSSRKVLISPQSVLTDYGTTGKFSVSLTTEQIKNSPDIDTDLPVSRQQEEILHMHHSWENYWESTFFGGGNTADAIPAVEVENANDDELPKATYDVSLQSAKNVSGYHIHAIGGEIGHLNNYILDDQTWTITDLVIDTANMIGGKKVLVPVSNVDALQWSNYEVYLNITPEAVENSAVYIPVE